MRGAKVGRVELRRQGEKMYRTDSSEREVQSALGTGLPTLWDASAGGDPRGRAIGQLSGWSKCGIPSKAAGQVRHCVCGA